MNVDKQEKMLREFIANQLRLLTEGKSIEDAASAGYALNGSKNSSTFIYTLYNPKEFIEMQKFYGYGPEDGVICTEMIVAILGVNRYRATQNNQWKTPTVTQAGANKGWGPTIYDIAMQLEGGLTPDRTDVSNAAANVWKFYYEKRKDVVHKPLDDERDPETPDTIDDTGHLHDRRFRETNPLDQAYIPKTKNPSIGTLIQNDKEFMSRFGKTVDIVASANAFFDVLYGNGDG